MLQKLPGSLRRILGSVSGLASTRLALFSLELQEESERQMRHLAWLLACVAALVFSVVFLSMGILLWGWTHGYGQQTAWAIAAFYGLLGLLAGLLLRRRIRNSPRPFAATRAEFDRDRQMLQERPEELP